MKGGAKMNATLLKTKAGKGFKICVNGTWMYTSKGELYKVLQDKANGCSFRSIGRG